MQMKQMLVLAAISGGMTLGHAADPATAPAEKAPKARKAKVLAQADAKPGDPAAAQPDGTRKPRDGRRNRGPAGPDGPGGPGGRSRTEAILKKLDKDNDGSLNKEEFAAYFEILDGNKDGKLTAEEIPVGRPMPRPAPPNIAPSGEAPAAPAPAAPETEKK